MKDSLEESAERKFQNIGDRLIFEDGAKWQQERICNSEVLQIIRASKSDAEARRIIRTI